MPPKRRPTIRDVARAAGVSITTVSQALNGASDVNEGTRAHIAAVAERLGYGANRTARALRSGATNVVALQLPDFTGDKREALDEDYFIQIAAAAANEAFALGYTLLLAPPIDNAATIRRLGIDGAILCDPNTNDARIGLFDTAAVPLVTIGRDIARADDRWHVRADSRGNMERLLEHLADVGAQRIALVAPATSWGYVRDSVDSYRAWNAARGLAPAVTTVSEVWESRDATLRILQADDPPDAIVGLVERICLGAREAAEQAGLSVPDDVMLACGVDGRHIAMQTPPVTAIDIHPREQGRRAVRLLIDRIAHTDTDGPVISSSELRVRASTARPAVLG